MSRTNPYKTKRRCAEKTLLIFGEGFDEEIFLKYLKSIYSCDCNVAIKIKKGKGGDGKNIINDAFKTPGAFGRRVVMLDNDKSLKEMEETRKAAKNKGIELIENTPCLEYLLLNILNVNCQGNSADCKREFESKYINKNKRGEINKYKKLFPKEKLEKKRKTIPILEQLVSVMEGK